ncbi:hypothetical protein KAV79_07475 [Candidatus Aerophobetes bacterium]|nr:hypothetical protein [Candidatus Aerophobetes bacterium]
MNAPKTERKIQGNESSNKAAYERGKKSFGRRVQGIFRSVFTLDRLRTAGLVGLVCGLSVILFLTLKGGRKNGKNNNGG